MKISRLPVSKYVYPRVPGMYVICFLVLFCLACDPEPDKELSLLERLQALDGVSVQETDILDGFSQIFQIDIRQPLDHRDAGRGTFFQRVYLSHRGEQAPMVFYATGYGVGRNYEAEPSALLRANQILMVHRFFPNAMPSPRDWSCLTIFQAASDQHRIRQLLGTIYTGPWLSSGASKGGMTSLFYRRFFPQDVTATIAYVAPVMSRTEDPRFRTFLRRVGSESCRERIRQFQRLVLVRRQAMMPLLRSYAGTQGYTFTEIRDTAVLEYMVLEYMFAFWQYGEESDCDGIPGDKADNRDIFNHLLDVSPPVYYSDQGIEYYSPLFYQAYTEFGYCPYIYDHLGDLLEEVGEPSYSIFAPRGVELDFRSDVMADVIPWLKNQGEHILYIYGAIDPWTAALLNPDPDLDALMLVQPGANHRVKIRDLDQKELVFETLQRWLQVPVFPSAIQDSVVFIERERF